MAVQEYRVLEGTWEEIAREGEHLCGRRVRLVVLPPEPGAEDTALPFYERATPEEWIAEWLAWGRGHAPRDAPPLSDAAISRESIYGERLDRQR